MITPMCNVYPLKPLVISPNYTITIRLNKRNRAKNVKLVFDGIKTINIDPNDVIKFKFSPFHV